MEAEPVATGVMVSVEPATATGDKGHVRRHGGIGQHVAVRIAEIIA